MSVEQLEATLTSSQDQTRITTKIQNKQPKKPTEDQLKRSLIANDLKKKPHRDSQKEHEQVWPCSHRWQLSVQRDSSAAKVTPKKRGLSTPSQDPQPRVPDTRRGTHITSGFENHWDSAHQGETGLCQRYRHPLKGPNLGLFGPDKLCWPPPEDSLTPCPTTKVCEHPAGGSQT